MPLFLNQVLVPEHWRHVAALTKREHEVEPQWSNASFLQKIGCRTIFRNNNITLFLPPPHPTLVPSRLLSTCKDE